MAAEPNAGGYLCTAEAAARCGLRALQAMPRGRAARPARRLLRGLLTCLPPATCHTLLEDKEVSRLVRCLSDVSALLVPCNRQPPDWAEVAADLGL